MVNVLMCLLAVLALEAAVAAGIFILRQLKPPRGRRGGDAEEDTDEGDEAEKLWQRGFEAMMRYDLDAARRAAGKREER